jgi:dTDP-4-amino-4,6-dideoxygalactose transaminase
MFQVVLPESKNLTRAKVMERMKEAGIGCGLHYPIISGFKLYQELGYKTSDTPIAERIGKTILTLPLFPKMERTDVERVAKALHQALISG